MELPSTRATPRAEVEVGICGSMAATDIPLRLALCHRAGLDYVSCSPFRVPIAGWPAHLHAALIGEPDSGNDGVADSAIPSRTRFLR